MNAIKNSNVSTSALNKLRAGVLGANDGIVSTAALIVGVAAATDTISIIFTAGLAALVSGALSMALGEYVSVSSQSDAEKAYITKERQKLQDNPEKQLEELTKAYVNRGVSHITAKQVAIELTKKDALKAHLETEFNLDEEDLGSPIHAAITSFISFALGGLIPLLTILLAPSGIRIPLTAGAVLVALFMTGYASASFGNAPKSRAIVRIIIGGSLAMVVTYVVGSLFGTTS